MVNAYLTSLLTILFLLTASGVSAAGYSSGAVIGEAATMLSAMNSPTALCGEVPLGDAAADAVRDMTGADIAILNGGDFRANLQSGEITWDTVLGLFGEERPLALARISPTELKAILEAGVSRIVLDSSEAVDYERSSGESFPQISGFSFKYDVSASPGDRILSITLGEDGGSTELDMTDSRTAITLSATEYMLSGGYGLPAISGYSPAGLTLAEAFAGYISNNSTLENPQGNRQSLIGSTTNNLASKLPVGILLTAVVLFATFTATVSKHGSVLKDRSGGNGNRAYYT